MRRSLEYSKGEKVHKNLALLLENIENILKKCEQFGFCKKTYYNVKNIRTNISMSTFLKLAKLLEIYPNDLLEILLMDGGKSILKSEYNRKKSNSKYKFCYCKLKEIFSNRKKELKEEGKTVSYLLDKEAKKELKLEQRQIENITYGKNCSLNAYLYTCDIFEVDSVEVLKKSIEEGEQCQ